MNVYFYLVLMAAVIGSPVFAAEPPTTITNEILATRIIYGTQPLILDVRTPEEFAAGHVPGAVNIPHDQVAERYMEVTFNPAEEIVVYCRSGKRAGAAAEVLGELGFTGVADLDGHWLAWSSAGLPFEEAVVTE